MENEVDGIRLGVFENGTVFFSTRAVGILCGVSHVAILKQFNRWDSGQRNYKFARLLSEYGITDRSLLVAVTGSKDTLVVPEKICTAFVEYYAFQGKPQARKTNRVFNHAGARMFVYSKIGFQASGQLNLNWRQFHDRCQLNRPPKGYFFVFNELSTFVLDAIRNGLLVDEHTIPDISVGRCWSDYWQKYKLSEKYSNRIQASHLYPMYFPQSVSNPQDAFVYPIEAKGAFVRWLDDVYLPEKFTAYIKRKVKKGDIEVINAMRLVDALVPKQLKGYA